MFITGALCIISTIVALLRNIKGDSALSGNVRLKETQELHIEDKEP